MTAPVTPAADAPVAPAAVVAHLERLGNKPEHHEHP
jgi:hypothetical protein